MSLFYTSHRVTTLVTRCRVRSLFTALYLALLHSGGQSALAQTVPTDSSAFNRELMEVTVSSSRINLKPSQLPQRINVVSSRDIELTPSLDVADAVKKLAAIDVVQYPQGTSFVNIRGFRPPTLTNTINPQTSILINGRQSGTVNLALIDPNSIERIEVLKGPAGAIYGSSTMGGVVNIITKQSRGKITGQLYGGYGSFQSTELGASVGGNITDRLDFNFSATVFDRNADIKYGNGNLFRNVLKGDQVTLFPTTGPVKETDAVLDGQTRNNSQMGFYTGTVRLGYQLSKNWRVDLTGDRYVARGIETSGDWHYGDAQRGLADRLRSSGEVAIRGDLGKHQLTVRGFSVGETNSVFRLTAGINERAAPVPTFKNSQQEVGYRGVLMQDQVLVSNNARLTIGADYTDVYADARAWTQGTAASSFTVAEGRPNTPNSTVQTLGPFVQGFFTLLKRKLTLNPGFRYEFINFAVKETPFITNIKPRQEANTFASPSFGAQYNLTSALALHGTVGRAFRFPRASEIAGYSEEYLTGNKVRIQIGNADLKNEQSVTYDFGVKINDARKGLRFDATYFQTTVKNRARQIDVPSQVGKPSPPNLTIDRYQTFINVDQSQISGLEVEGSYDFGARADYRYSLRVFTNATRILKAEDITKNDGKPDDVLKVNNVADLTLSYGLDYSYQKFQARLTGRYVGSRFDNDFGNLNTALRGALIEYAPYVTLDIVASYALTANHSLSARISNLTDENYYEKRGFNLPGRAVGLRYTYRF